MSVVNFEHVIASWVDAEVVKPKNSSFTLIPSLISSQKEADRKVVLHAKVLLETNDTITIRSPSTDTDMVVLLISLLWKFKEQVMFMDKKV